MRQLPRRELPEIELDRPMPQAQAEAWSLALSSATIPHALDETADGWYLDVPERSLKRARAVLRRYVAEQAVADERAADVAEAKAFDDAQPLAWPILVPLALAGFHMAAHGTALGVDWLKVGDLASKAFREGELWRAVTALTLHVDAGHLASNILLGSVIVGALVRVVGAGLAWALTLGAGVLGNLVNAPLHPDYFHAIGASTAVFGALGALAVIRGAQRPLPSWREAIVPLGAGLALLGFLGTSEKSDLGGHFFGFAGGALLGLTVAAARRFRRPARVATRLWLALAMLGVTLGCWLLAVRH